MERDEEVPWSSASTKSLTAQRLAPAQPGCRGLTPPWRRGLCLRTMSVAVATTYVFRRSHDWILQFLEGLSEEELRWVGGPGAPSIAFHAWHSARWADLLQS